MLVLSPQVEHWHCSPLRGDMIHTVAAGVALSEPFLVISFKQGSREMLHPFGDALVPALDCHLHDPGVICG